MSDVLRECLERDGFVVVEGALAPAEVVRLHEAVEQVRRREASNGDALHRLGFVGLDPAFLDLLDHPAAFRLVVDALGWNVYLYHCHLDVHPPRDAAAPQWRWHQDGGRQNVELTAPRPRLSLKIPGSHVRDTLPRPADGGVDPPGAVPLTLAAGTAVVFDRRLWHARGDNRSQRTRIALFYGYTYRWIRPRDELDLEPGLLDRLDPVKRQLLGGGTSAIGYWIPTDEDVPLRAAR